MFSLLQLSSENWVPAPSPAPPIRILVLQEIGFGLLKPRLSSQSIPELIWLCWKIGYTSNFDG